MGKREEALETLLELIGVPLSSRTLDFPSKDRATSSELREEIQQVYCSLGGILSSFPLNLRKWDIEADGVAIELDENLHFNRYRAITLESRIYKHLPAFPYSEYVKYCSLYESDCLRAGGYGGKWSNNSCEKQFGKAALHKDLSGNGAPRWKQRAFYDFVKDFTPLILGVPMVRISIWDLIEIGGQTIKVNDALYRRERAVAEALQNLIRQRIPLL